MEPSKKRNSLMRMLNGQKKRVAKMVSVSIPQLYCSEERGIKAHRVTVR
jgi:hypothetical protein